MTTNGDSYKQFNLSRTSRALSRGDRDRERGEYTPKPEQPLAKPKTWPRFFKHFIKKPKVDTGDVTEDAYYEQPTLFMKFMFLYRLFNIVIISISLINIGYTIMPINFLFYKNTTVKTFTRKVSDFLQNVWVNSCLYMFPKYDLFTYGELPTSPTTNLNAPKIIICNHTTQADWIYLWMLTKDEAQNVDFCGNVKIMLKNDIKYLPIFGWGCVLFQFIFLKRDWKKDEKIIQAAVEDFCSTNIPLWIFIFPEGNTVNTRSLVKCHEFAANSNRPILEKSLLPRVKGFQSLLELLNKYSKTEPEVFDVTMTFQGYSGEVPTWEMGYGRIRDKLIPTIGSFILGTCSKQCHMECTKFSAADILNSKGGVQRWLDDRWLRKERLLNYFATKQQFPDREVGEFNVTRERGQIKFGILVVSIGVIWYASMLLFLYKLDGFTILSKFQVQDHLDRFGENLKGVKLHWDKTEKSQALNWFKF